MGDDFTEGVIATLLLVMIPMIIGLSFGVDQVVHARMWEASENVCKENGGVLEVVADSFHWTAYCGNGVSKEFSIK